ncbi:amino-acid N-acetyltransferase [Phycicoccus sp. Root101]|uniref:amino-acid N-acetyltransferase n=1 Tax=Phycicoccus sp. Root101 TaxID=1736421 RepID=UPI000AD75A95|nr:amino-acid N-acetyltransferase [Phycicoccus sp. Root101]
MAPEPGLRTTGAGPTGGLVVRRARTSDIRAIRDLVRPHAESRVLVSKDAVTYYEAVQQFRVAEVGDGSPLLGCGALHVMWEDLAEIRTLAVSPAAKGRGVGSQLLEALMADARELGVQRLFCLTFEVDFFTRHGFEVIEGQAVEPEVYAELVRSYDEGVAEFLDLERVKPNTLGNTRMLLTL